MTRRRSSAPGARPARRLLLLVPLAAALVAACAGTTGTPRSEGATVTPAATTRSTSEQSAAPTTPEPPTAAPDSQAPATTEPATEGPATEEPATPVPEPVDVGGADACTGTDENRAFYLEFARAVDWPVYCPSLPRGWYVGTGQWRQADGGRLEISYRGPNGAGLMLQEGAFCPGEGDCVPPGEDMGRAAFGDRDGTLVDTADGWAIVVDRGQRPSWLLTLSGVSEAGAREIAEDLVRIDA